MPGLGAYGLTQPLEAGVSAWAMVPTLLRPQLEGGLALRDCLAEARVCPPVPALPVLPSGPVIAWLYSVEEEPSGFEGGGHARGEEHSKRTGFEVVLHCS